jgi:hypothetical protein
MSPTIIRDFHTELVETIRDNARANKWWSSPVNLGGVAGVSGGIGAPVGGLFGQLIQSKIAYDLTEDSYSGIYSVAPSGSLVDNLAHIRYRIQVLESGGIAGEITIKENGIVIASGITVIDFVGGDVTLVGPGEVTVTFSGGTALVSGLGLAGTLIYESMNSQINGITDHFDLSQEAISGYFGVYLNGLRQSDSYYSVDTNWQGFTTTFIPEVPDDLFAQYLISTSGVTLGGGGGGFTSDLALWDADSPPLTSNGYDDEFNNLSLDPKWTEWDEALTLTLNETERGLEMILDSAMANRFAGIYQQHNNSDITIYTKVSSLNLQTAGEIKAGIILGSGIFADPATGDFVGYVFYNGGAGTGLQVETWNDYQNINTTLVNNTSILWLTDVYLRVRYDSAAGDYSFGYSSDGVGWTDFRTENLPISGLLEVGLGVRSDITTFDPKAIFSFFRTIPTVGITIVMDGDRLDYQRTV